MREISFAALAEIVLPTRTIRVCDGGFVRWGANLFRDQDAVFGVLGSVGELSEGVGEEVPVFDLTFLPPGETPPADLSQPGFQTSVARFWLAEIDIATGAVIGTPDLLFEGELDQTSVTFGADGRTVDMAIVSAAARLLERNIGNGLSAVWHRSIWPGEAGHDQATGLGRPIAWGVVSGRTGGSVGGAGGRSGGFSLNPVFN